MPILRKRQFRYGDGQHGCMLRPGLVEFHERAENFLEAVPVSPGSDEKRPRLLVIAGGRPARGFKQALENFRRNHRFRESARAPALANQFMDGVLRRCRLLHLFSPKDFQGETVAGDGFAPPGNTMQSSPTLAWITCPA